MVRGINAAALDLVGQPMCLAQFTTFASPLGHNDCAEWFFTGAVTSVDFASDYDPALSGMDNLNLGAALCDQGLYAEACTAYRAALALEPERWGLWSNLLFSLHFDPALSADFTAQLERGVKGVRIGVPRSLLGDGLDPAVRERTLEVLGVYEREGATLVDIELPNARHAIPVYYLVATAEASSNLARYDGVRYTTRAKLAAGADLTEAANAFAARACIVRRVKHFDHRRFTGGPKRLERIACFHADETRRADVMGDTFDALWIADLCKNAEGIAPRELVLVDKLQQPRRILGGRPRFQCDDQIAIL